MPQLWLCRQCVVEPHCEFVNGEAPISMVKEAIAARPAEKEEEDMVPKHPALQPRRCHQLGPGTLTATLMAERDSAGEGIISPPQSNRVGDGIIPSHPK